MPAFAHQSVTGGYTEQFPNISQYTPFGPIQYITSLEDLLVFYANHCIYDWHDQSITRNIVLLLRDSIEMLQYYEGCENY